MSTDRITSILFLVVSIAAWTQTGNLQEICSVFPRIVALFLGGLSLLMLVFSFFKKKATRPANGQKEDITCILICLVVVIVWIWLLKVIGFLVSGVIFLSALTLVLDRARPTSKRIAQALWIYLLVVSAFWLAFHKLLLVPLPEGLFI